MGCKHELPQCRNGDSSRAVSAFAQFAVVINGGVRIFFYVWFKVAALKLLGQMCLMRRDTCRKPGLFGGAQPFPPPCGAPSIWGITPKPCLAHGHQAVPSPAQQTSGIPLGNNHLTQHQSHKLTFTYQRDTGPGVCLLFQKTPISSSSSSPLPSFQLFFSCFRICIFQVYVLMKWKEKGMSLNLKTSTAQSHHWEKHRDAILRIAFTQGHISYLKHIFSQKGASMHEELSGSFLVFLIQVSWSPTWSNQYCAALIPLLSMNLCGKPTNQFFRGASQENMGLGFDLFTRILVRA